MTCARKLTPIVALFALLGFLAAPSNAAGTRTSPEQAAKFVSTLGQRAVTLLSNYSEEGASKHQAEFKDMVRSGFDLELIGRFALGGAWRTATPAQQKEYQTLFASWVLDSYARRLGAYKGERFSIITSRPFADQDALVETEITRPNGEPIKAGWRVREINSSMKIIDVVVEGVSMALTQRQEFASVIQHQGLDGLIRDLRDRVNNLQTETSKS